MSTQERAGLVNVTERRRLFAMMMAAGWSNVDIAAEFGITANYVSVMRTSPLMQGLIAEMQAELRSRTVEDAMMLIEREGTTSVRVLAEIRDELGEGVAADRNVRRQAANDLLDRHPKLAKRSRVEEEHVHRIVFSAADVERMRASLPARALPAASAADSSE